jgi:hypothetical protein
MQKQERKIIMKYSRKLINDYETYDLVMTWLTGYPEFYHAPLNEEGFIDVFWKREQAVLLNDMVHTRYRYLMMEHVYDDVDIKKIYEAIKDDYKLFPDSFRSINAEGLDISDIVGSENIIEDEDRCGPIIDNSTYYAQYSHIILDENVIRLPEDNDLPF